MKDDIHDRLLRALERAMTAGCISGMDMDTRRKWEIGDWISLSGKVIGVYTGMDRYGTGCLSPLAQRDALMHNVR